MFAQVIFRTSRRVENKQTVMITIDDGPSLFSEDLLACLEGLNCPAVHFWIGKNVHRYSTVAKTFASTKQVIANHDYDNRVSCLAPDLVAGITKTKEAIQTFIPESQRRYYFRPGCALFYWSMIWMVQNVGYWIVLGSVYFRDPFWSCLTCVVPVRWVAWLQFLFFRWQISNGSIVVMHDGSKRRVELTVATLKLLVPWLHQNGFAFTTQI